MQNKQQISAAVQQALQQAIATQFPHDNFTLDSEGECGAFVGYGDFSAAHARALFPAVVAAMQGTNVDWGNLHTTIGDEDTVVEFTVNNVQCVLCTCYGA